MRFFKRGETAVSRFIFRDFISNEPIDVENPQYDIVYHSNGDEIEVVELSDLQKVEGKIGIYICSWEIPEIAIENTTYFVTGYGVNQVRETNLIVEDMYRVLPITFFGDVSNGGITAKFSVT